QCEAIKIPIVPNDCVDEGGRTVNATVTGRSTIAGECAVAQCYGGGADTKGGNAGSVVTAENGIHKLTGGGVHISGGTDVGAIAPEEGTVHVESAVVRIQARADGIERVVIDEITIGKAPGT